MGAWGEWSKCSETCGQGYQTMSRIVEVNPLHGGTACPERTTKRICNQTTCIGAYTILMYKNKHILLLKYLI